MLLLFPNLAVANRSTQVRVVRTLDLRASAPISLAWAPEDGAFAVLEDGGPGRGTRMLLFDSLGRPRGGIPAPPGPARAVAWDAGAGRLRLIDARARRLGLDVEVLAVTRDEHSGTWFVLDGDSESLVLSRPGQGLRRLPTPDDARALAFHPQERLLYVVDAAGLRLTAVDVGGEVRETFDLSFAGLENVRGIVLAPTGDTTDDPARLGLYVLDASASQDGGPTARIVELSLAAPAATPPVDVVATLVQTVDLSGFSPPSPDPAGIARLPGSPDLLVSDSEVNEIPALFTGFNLFEVASAGTLIGIATTLPFSDEPTGAAIDPATGLCFFSDDTSDREVHVVDPGLDDECGTPDDSVTSLDTEEFGGNDPEGVAFGGGFLFIADGLNNEVYRVDPGQNGIFDGVPPEGDDLVTQFDTVAVGIEDPEGIEYDPQSGDLYIVGEPIDRVARTTNGGSLVRTIDISAADPKLPAGLALAPGSQNPLAMTLWLVARGVDNNSDPDENDGKLYELCIPPMGGNQSPSVDAGAPQTLTLPTDTTTLTGTASDDGYPCPPAIFTTAWTQEAGPPGVSFTDAADPQTQVTFPGTGTYLLRLSAGDTQFLVTDDVTISVGSSTAPCDDGVDNDADGYTDVDDRGCFDASSPREDPACQDGLDNDEDGRVDFDGGALLNGGVPLFPPDPQCKKASGIRERRFVCGLGAELALLLPLALAWRGRIRARAARVARAA